VVHSVLIALVAFASANIDDVFLLMAWLGESPSVRLHIYAGQFIGFGILGLGSAVCSLLALRVPSQYFAMFGVFPILIGLRRLWKIWMHGAKIRPAEAASSKALAVAAVTIASGADDVAIFTPLMTKGGISSLPLILVVFLVMTAIWCLLATVLVNHRAVARFLNNWGDRFMPIVLIGLGVSISWAAF